MSIASEAGVLGGSIRSGGGDGALNNDGDNEAVDTEHTSHDYGDDELHDHTGVHHTGRGNTNTSLGSSVSSANV